MRVSILINNYNYARYVGRAIESALNQTWPDLQIVVVDDGSTDASWDVITSYGDRLIAVRTPNGGQGAAYNVGFLHADGEWVLFLDADDCLDPDAIEQCAALIADDVSKVQFPLRLVDHDDRPIGGTVPYLMHDDAHGPGTVLELIKRFGHYAGPPSSGNFYRRTAITPYFPIVAEHWRRAADTVPFLAAPFHGRVVSTTRTLGAYRLHRQVNRASGVFGNISRSISDSVSIEQSRRQAALAWLSTRTGISLEGPFLPLPWGVRARALSWRLERASHPWQSDSRVHLLAMQWRTVRSWPGYRPAERWLMVAWIALVLTLPQWMVRRVAVTNTSGAAKAWVRRVTDRLG